jgi:CheY-like chemotaxis protein
MPRIVVVDEDLGSRQQAAKTLRGLGCIVRTVSDPEAAAAAMRRRGADAVLVSANLTRMTSAEFVDRLRQDERLGKVPVVVTAVTPRAAIDAIRVGARGCIRKPLDIGGVQSTLGPLLKRERSPRYPGGGRRPVRYSSRHGYLESLR